MPKFPSGSPATEREPRHEQCVFTRRYNGMGRAKPEMANENSFVLSIILVCLSPLSHHIPSHTLPHTHCTYRCMENLFGDP